MSDNKIFVLVKNANNHWCIYHNTEHGIRMSEIRFHMASKGWSMQNRYSGPGNLTLIVDQLPTQEVTQVGLIFKQDEMFDALILNRGHGTPQKATHVHLPADHEVLKFLVLPDGGRAFALEPFTLEEYHSHFDLIYGDHDERPHHTLTQAPALPQGCPLDWENPDWSKVQGGNWHFYINEELQILWPTFTHRHRQLMALNAEQIADNEPVRHP
jgi:hypothetical protein